MSLVGKLFKYGFAALGALLLLSALGGIWVAEIPMTLAFGWIAFLLRSLGSVSWAPLEFVRAAVVGTVLFFGTDRAMAWLATRAGFEWSRRSTGFALGLLFVCFLACMSTFGIAHHVAWLATQPEPLLEGRGLPGFRRLHLRTICRELFVMQDAERWSATRLTVEALIHDERLEKMPLSEMFRPVVLTNDAGAPTLLAFLPRDPVRAVLEKGVWCTPETQSQELNDDALLDPLAFLNRQLQPDGGADAGLVDGGPAAAALDGGSPEDGGTAPASDAGR